jgi:hypothetical protein
LSRTAEPETKHRVSLRTKKVTSQQEGQLHLSPGQTGISAPLTPGETEGEIQAGEGKVWGSRERWLPMLYGCHIRW